MVDARFSFSPRMALLLGLMALAVVSRVVTSTAAAWSGYPNEVIGPYLANVAPVVALALFGGAVFRHLGLALVVTLGAMLTSDLLLQVAYWQGWSASQGFHSGMPVIYVAFLATIGLGRIVGRWLNPVSVIGGSLLASTLFFLVTNFAVWVDGRVGYPHTWVGLVACFEAALPFFRNAIVGDLAFCTLLFGSYGLAIWGVPATRLVANRG